MSRGSGPLAVLVAYTGLGALLAVLVVSRLATVPVHRSFVWPVLSAAMACCDLIGSRFLPDDRSLQFDLVGVPIAVGAVFLSPSHVLAGVLLGTALSAGIRRDPLEQAGFNVVNLTVAACVARVVLSGALGSASPLSGRGAGAVAATCLGFEVASMTGVVVALSLTGNRPAWDQLKAMVIQSAIVLPLTAMLAVVTVTVISAATWGAFMLAAPAVLLGLWHLAAHQARARYGSLQSLYEFTVRLSETAETEQIMVMTLVEAARILDVSHAHLRVPAGLGGGQLTVRDGQLIRDESPVPSIEAEAASGHRAQLISRRRGDRMPDGYNLDQLIAVPVPLGELGTAVMVAGHRSGQDQAFSGADVRFVEALAANLGTALTSSLRLDQLRLEVGAREHQALHDSLTGLANRILFGKWVARSLEQRGETQRVGVMVMDLDGFKDINDTLGHHTGDLILQAVAARVRDGGGRARLAARMGGDEFAFVIPNATSREQVVAEARAIVEAVSQPVIVNGTPLDVRASLGVAVAPDDGTDPTTLLRLADVAMYAAKTGRHGVVDYDGNLDRHARRRLTLTNELRQAVEHQHMEIWYQPLTSISSGEVMGMEALLRWRHPELGLIPPSEFISVAEQSGLIEPLTWWVLESSLKELARWRQEGYDLTMAVNVSARSLIDPYLASRLAELLNAVGIPAGDLTLEVTESMMLTDPDRSQRGVEEVAALGVRIAIDDFGTGYSSLSRLRRLPVRTVKIDRSFIAAMHRDEADEAIVRATIELARNMGHEVIAEGVERTETWDRLAALGCDMAQGHMLAPAMPVEVCREWLSSRQSPRMATISSLRPARGA